MIQKSPFYLISTNINGHVLNIFMELNARTDDRLFDRSEVLIFGPVSGGKSVQNSLVRSVALIISTNLVRIGPW